MLKSKEWTNHKQCTILTASNQCCKASFWALLFLDKPLPTCTFICNLLRQAFMKIMVRLQHVVKNDQDPNVHGFQMLP